MSADRTTIAGWLGGIAGAGGGGIAMLICCTTTAGVAGGGLAAAGGVLRSPWLITAASAAITTYVFMCGTSGTSDPRSPSLAYTSGFTSTAICRIGKLSSAFRRPPRRRR